MDCDFRQLAGSFGLNWGAGQAIDPNRDEPILSIPRTILRRGSVSNAAEVWGRAIQSEMDTHERFRQSLPETCSGRAEFERPLLHLGCHQVQRIGAGRGKMLLEASLVDEREVGRQDRIRGFPVEHPDEEGDHSLGDD